MKMTTKAGLKVRTSVKSGGIGQNHNRAGLKVRAGIKAAGIGQNHNRAGLKVRVSIKAGYTAMTNHVRRMAAVA